MKIGTYFFHDRIESLRVFGIEFETIWEDATGMKIEIEICDGIDVINLFSAGVQCGIKKAHEDMRKWKQPVHISEPLQEIDNQLQQSQTR